MRRTARLAPTPLAALILVAGCAGRDAHRVGVHPARGTLDVAGIPAGGACVAFHPVDGNLAAVVCPTAVVHSDGTFRLRTYDPDDGAPAGEYVVTVVWPDPSIPADECADPVPHDRLRGLYADRATSQLRATVGPGGNEIALHATVGTGGWNLPKMRDAAVGGPERGGRDAARGERPADRRE